MSNDPKILIKSEFYSDRTDGLTSYIRIKLTSSFSSDSIGHINEKIDNTATALSNLIRVLRSKNIINLEDIPQLIGDYGTEISLVDKQDNE